MAPQGVTLQGTVKSFNPLKGWGYITLADGEEIFVNQEHVAAYVLEAGQPVQFEVRNDEKHPGKFTAFNVQVISQTPDGSDIEVFFGEIRSFNPEKGFGFLSSEASHAKYGKDILFLRHECVELKGAESVVPSEGTPCSFQVKQGINGWICNNVFFSGASFDRALEMHCKMCDGLNGVFYGKVLKFYPDRGYGMITSDAVASQYGREVMVQRNELSDEHAEAGTRVRFNITQAPQGLIAMNVKVLRVPPSEKDEQGAWSSSSSTGDRAGGYNDGYGSGKGGGYGGGGRSGSGWNDSSWSSGNSWNSWSDEMWQGAMIWEAMELIASGTHTSWLKHGPGSKRAEAERAAIVAEAQASLRESGEGPPTTATASSKNASAGKGASSKSVTPIKQPMFDKHHQQQQPQQWQQWQQEPQQQWQQPNGKGNSSWGW
eukprot:gnl/TRDRNA2_/TRDRNA2_90646_c0_seq2.p1 gnl/TRDRNA2_/TRDRNA2_90646_c0~~gnl/TRDRNA2_/TRDRNA2_90646_c0_seq2.p1  ORF type:complete len:430 (-),score=79.17 gnl/TRDRNA2_/TRDRNA2_90646_c0_seq2:23-1312(-)